MGGGEVRAVNLPDNWKPVHQPASFSGKQQSTRRNVEKEISPQVRSGKLEKINQEMVEAVAHLCQVNVKVDI